MSKRLDSADVAAAAAASSSGPAVPVATESAPAAAAPAAAVDGAAAAVVEAKRAPWPSDAADAAAAAAAEMRPDRHDGVLFRMRLDEQEASGVRMWWCRDGVAEPYTMCSCEKVTVTELSRQDGAPPTSVRLLRAACRAAPAADTRPLLGIIIAAVVVVVGGGAAAAVSTSCRFSACARILTCPPSGVGFCRLGGPTAPPPRAAPTMQ
ncbi:hypothetical protein MBLNU459_g1493t1 [Dothideomycetes sp. NU459]